MKKSWLIVILMFCSFVLAGNVQSASLEGDPSLITFENWLPTDACIAFYYVNNKVDGFEVRFRINEGGTKLFRNWLIRLDDGTATFVPFIIEVTAILSNGDAFYDPAHVVDQYAWGTQGAYWDFGKSDQCVNTPIAYLDTHLSDDASDKFGIGILNPYQLNEGATYKFWIKLEQLVQDVSNITVQLRFRLNIDVNQAQHLGWNPGDNFEMGRGWNIAYYMFPYSPLDPQMIAESASFAIEQFKSQDQRYAGPKSIMSLPIFNVPIVNLKCP